MLINKEKYKLKKPAEGINKMSNPYLNSLVMGKWISIIIFYVIMKSNLFLKLGHCNNLQCGISAQIRIHQKKRQ